MGQDPYHSVETTYSPHDDVVPAVPTQHRAPTPVAQLPSPYQLQPGLQFTETTTSQAVSGRINSVGQASAREDPNALLLGQSQQQHQQHQQQLQEDAAKYPFYNPRKYREYFNVDTKDVLWRVGSSLIGPFKPDFIQVTWESPDLYGPFWVATTLIFVIAVAGNYANYWDWSKSQESSTPPSSGTTTPTQWYNDYAQLGISAGVVYGYIFVLGIGLWFLARYFKGELKIANILCIYGYCLTIFIPVSFICIIPLNWLRWTAVGIATGVSGMFLVANFRATFYAVAPAKAVMFMLGIAALHVCLGIALKLLFFSY